jgi:hypothetical protein
VSNGNKQSPGTFVSDQAMIFIIPYNQLRTLSFFTEHAPRMFKTGTGTG